MPHLSYPAERVASHGLASRLLASVAIVSILAGGCQAGARTAGVVTPQAAQPQYGGGPMPAGALPQGYAVMAMPQTQLVDARAQEQVLELKQRLERIEQALLRLDRRMQLVERNELGRMGSAGDGAVTAAIQEPEAVLARQSLGLPQRQEMEEAQVVSGPVAQQGFESVSGDGYQPGFRPVSQVDTVIRSSLQAAPQRLPSLADPVQGASAPLSDAQANVAIWTVKFEDNKVWPERDQLPASQRVVELLRNHDQVAVVARGPNPSHPMFQERVRALSRYLAKVSSLETVPIRAMATPQMQGDTIEILATP